MKYFEYTAFLAFFLSALAVTALFYRRLRVHHFYRLAWKSLLKKRQKACDAAYCPSFYLFEIVKKLVGSTGRESRRALAATAAGRLQSAEKYFERQKDVFHALVLKALREPELAASAIEAEIRNNPSDGRLLAELAYLYFICGDTVRCRLCLDNVNEKKINSYGLAKVRYLQSFYDLNDGDMLSASQNCSEAVRLFHKNRAYYEEAQAYLQMGVIYRASVVTDVSQIMLETALKIFSALGCRAETAETYGNLGMLMAIQKRFEEAEDFYLKAEKICTETGRRQAQAEINNQQGLLQLLKNAFVEAEELAQKALKAHSALKNAAGIAFSKEIIANSRWNRKDYPAAIHMAFEAKNLYRQSNNFSACFEMMYLMALALFEQRKLAEAEKVLREIVSLSKKHNSNFHTANAYNLLGLIYLQKQDLRRAKGLFQQSLDLEQVNNRLGGIATDYVNIGTVELTRGNREQAHKTLKTALEYAEASEDEELIALLRKRVDELLKS